MKFLFLLIKNYVEVDDVIVVVLTMRPPLVAVSTDSLQEGFDETELFLLDGILGRLFEFGEMREDLVEHWVVLQLRFELVFDIRVFRESPAESVRPSQHSRIKCARLYLP